MVELCCNKICLNESGLKMTVKLIQEEGVQIQTIYFGSERNKMKHQRVSRRRHTCIEVPTLLVYTGFCYV